MDAKTYKVEQQPDSVLITYKNSKGINNGILFHQAEHYRQFIDLLNEAGYMEVTV